MRLVTYQSEEGPRVAGVRGEDYIDLQQTDAQLPAALRELLASDKPTWDRARQAIAQGRPLQAQNVRLRAPIPNPEKVLCIGLNYADHAAESGSPVPEEPVVFNKFPTAVCGHGDSVVLPSLSKEVDYEAELVVIIGRGGRDIPRQQALEHVAGYTCGHDVSARDWQLRKPGKQWLLGKSFDGFAPMGPYLVSPDEVGDPGQLAITLRLNGQIMQQSSTRQLIFPVDQLIAYISGVCTLKPGDVIFTGTPPGVGVARRPPVFLQPGDEVEVEIERVGCLRNRFIGEGVEDIAQGGC